jgi:4-amino-4-deoxy-L-arabinose transferase-like glycosyltransferase
VKRRLVVAAVLFAASFGLYLYRLGGRFSNGDEAIYAESAREMATRGDWLTLRWQGKEKLERPPTSVWPLALAYEIFGPDEAALRGVCALEAALTVALLFLMAARRWDPGVAMVAALALALSARWYLSARYIESDPLLCLFFVAALLCWEKARDRPRWIYGWAFCLAGALMTKPFVGVLPLLAPLSDLAERRPLDWRRLGSAILVATLLTLPWHVYATVRFGREFARAFIVDNILQRSSQALHQHHGPSFYYLMLWYLEGPLVLISALGLMWAAFKREWLVVLWVAAVLLPFTIAKSRYTHYLMPLYPALGLATALAVMRALPRWRVPVASVFVAMAVVTHILPFARTPEGDDEIAALAKLARAASRPDDVLFVVDQYSFSARFYAERRTIEVHMKRGWETRSLVLPGEVVEATDLTKVTGRYPRWFAIAPRDRWAQLRSLGIVRLVGQTPRYLLLTNLERPGSSIASP